MKNWILPSQVVVFRVTRKTGKKRNRIRFWRFSGYPKPVKNRNLFFRFTRNRKKIETFFSGLPEPGKKPKPFFQGNPNPVKNRNAYDPVLTQFFSNFDHFLTIFWRFLPQKSGKKRNLFSRLTLTGKKPKPFFLVNLNR